MKGSAGGIPSVNERSEATVDRRKTESVGEVKRFNLKSIKGVNRTSEAS